MTALCEFTILLNGEAVVHDVVRVQVKSDRVYLRDVVGETLEIPYACRMDTVDVATQRIALRVSGAMETTAIAVAVAT